MTKTKHLRKAKQNLKSLFSVFFFVTFSKGATTRQKANAYHEITQILQTRTHLSNHALNGISLHYVGFELFKKVLLVALGIWLRIYQPLHK